MRSQISVAGIIVGVFIAAAVPSTHAAPSDEPCSLLTQDQVTATLGVAVSAPHETTTTLKPGFPI